MTLNCDWIKFENKTNNLLLITFELFLISALIIINKANYTWTLYIGLEMITNDNACARCIQTVKWKEQVDTILLVDDFWYQY